MKQGHLLIYFTSSNQFENLSIPEYQCCLLTQLLLSCHCLSTFLQPDTSQQHSWKSLWQHCKKLPSSPLSSHAVIAQVTTVHGLMTLSAKKTVVWERWVHSQRVQLLLYTSLFKYMRGLEIILIQIQNSACIWKIYLGPWISFLSHLDQNSSKFHSYLDLCSE